MKVKAKIDGKILFIKSDIIIIIIISDWVE